MIAQAKHEAEEKAVSLLRAAEAEVQNEYHKAHARLRQEAVDLGCQIAEQILRREVDRKVHEAWLSRFLEKSA
jgi:F0F1-type ATP synthase membrane subunit b/b'